VRGLAATLDGWGVGPGDRVALMAENGPNWATIDFAILSLGAVSVPIYSTLLPEGAAYVVRDSGAKVLFVQGEERLAGLLELRAEMPSLERIVAFGATPRPDVVPLAEAIAAGAGVEPTQFEGWLDRANPTISQR
jgi:long-chain acyl-CoA synthetase